jgi:flagellar basal body P-ring formation protein FlgA
MIRKLIIALTALAALTGAAGAQVVAALDSPHPRLRAEAVVTGAIVRIGDLVENAGIVANVPIFRSPDLGSTGTVSADAVVEAVRAHALIGLDTGDVRDVVVTRAARTIEPQQIESTLAAALSTQYALGPSKNVVVSFDRALAPLHVEPTAKGAPRVLRLGYEPRNGRFDATLEIPGRAALRLNGQARIMVEVLTVARPLRRGEILKQADVVIERHPRAEVGRDYVADRGQAIGLAARNDLQPGRLLRAADLMKPEVVRRNELVTLVYEVPGITLTVRGKATEGGAEGDVIGVLNEQSKRVLEGVVAGPGRVVIASGAPRLAANLPPTAERAAATRR